MAGKITRPNRLQKLLHAVFMQRPVTKFFSTRANAIDGFIYKVTRGRHTLTELLGWYIVHLTTVGAKSGRVSTIPLVALPDGERIGLIASNFGGEHHPAWYYNLKKHPECEARLGERTGVYIARETDGEERERLWQMAVAYYAGYEKYKQRAAPRRIPVIVLDPKK